MPSYALTLAANGQTDYQFSLHWAQCTYRMKVIVKWPSIIGSLIGTAWHLIPVRASPEVIGVLSSYLLCVDSAYFVGKVPAAMWSGTAERDLPPIYMSGILKIDEF